MIPIINVTHDQFMEWQKEFHDKCYQITSIKNKDYSPGADPFANFRKSNDLLQHLGERAPMGAIRLDVDKKMSRITNFILTGHRSEKNSEPFCNDYFDGANYILLALAYARSIGIDIYK